MAFYSGFFNSKGLDRTYTAEDFTSYLSSIICNGILDTYGQMFELTAASTGLKVTLGTGKAWINGHYFINDAKYSIDLSEYQDESLPRYVAISILLDTSEAVRSVSLEITPGTPAESPSLPSFPADENKTRLLMYGVRLNVGATELSDRDWYDYREDKNVCGYCKCILGKCKVTELQSQLAQLIAEVQENNDTIADLINKVEQLEAEVEDIGDVVDAGQCGDQVFYVRYSTGKVLLRGTGPMYDFDVNSNRSPFYRNDAVKTAVISNGITTVGEDAFEGCLNLESVSLPTTLTSIGSGAFMPADEYMGAAGKLSSIIIPQNVTVIGSGAFWGAALESITIPHNVSDVGNYAFRDCTFLKSVRYEGAVIGGYMFVSCSSMREFTIAKTVTKIGEHCFNYCKQLETITYEGSIDDWNDINKGSNWAGKSGQDVGRSGLTKIQCLDGHLDWDNETREWVEVRD